MHWRTVLQGWSLLRSHTCARGDSLALRAHHIGVMTCAHSDSGLVGPLEMCLLVSLLLYGVVDT
jgi:hypothetical protein